MSLGNTTEDGDKTLFSQQEASETSSHLYEFPTSTNVLVVDSSFITLLNMKKIMKQLAYQVTVYSNAEEAIAFLTTCKHEIDIVIWDFHMPGINGLQALKIIGSKMDLPVVIMSDDSQTESVMSATLHGACDYVMKPVREEIITNIWQHIVRKRMMSKPALIPPVELDVIQNDGSKQEEDDSMSVDQSDSEQNIERTEEQAVNYGSRTVSQYKDGERNIDKQNEKKSRKPRMSWTIDLQQKFLQAIDIVGGPERANPKLLLQCLREMKVEGLTRSNVSSHLQKHRLMLEENQIPQQTRETDWSSASRSSPVFGLNNSLTATSSVMNDPAVYPVQENQYQNGFMALGNNNQFVTNNTMPSLPYFDHDHHLLQQLQQQQYQLPQQLNDMTRMNEPEQASYIDLTDVEPLYPTSLPYDPIESLLNGCNFSQ